MATLYTLSTLNEYTWTGFYGDKQIYLSYIAVSKSQAISGLLALLRQLENNKKKTVEQDINLYIGEKELEYDLHTIVTTVENKSFTIGDLVLTTEPTFKKFRLLTIRD